MGRAGQLQFVTSRRSGGCQEVVTTTTGCGVFVENSKFPANVHRRVVLAPVKMGCSQSSPCSPALMRPRALGALPPNPRDI